MGICFTSITRGRSKLASYICGSRCSFVVILLRMQHSVFDFMALPPELRVQIYVHYMNTPRITSDPNALNICFINTFIRAEFEAEVLKARKQSIALLQKT